MTFRPLQTEDTEVGTQTLVPGVRPVTTKDKLQHLMAGPLVPRKPQKPPSIGLFDETARNQLDFFIHSKA